MHDRLRAARKRKRLTQINLARALDVHEASIRKWEAGAIKNIQIDSLYKLIKTLGVRFEWLVTGEEPMCAPGRADLSEPRLGVIESRLSVIESRLAVVEVSNQRRIDGE